MNVYCEGKKCSKKDTCQRHVMIDNVEYKCADHSTFKDGNFITNLWNSKTACGDNGNYAMYIHNPTVGEFITENLVAWKEEIGINEPVLFTYHKGVIHIYSNHINRLRRDGDILTKKYTEAFSRTLDDFKEIQFQYLYKSYVVAYTLTDDIIKIDDIAYVRAENENDAQIKLEEAIIAKKSDCKIGIIYVKEVTTEIYSKVVGLM